MLLKFKKLKNNLKWYLKYHFKLKFLFKVMLFFNIIHVVCFFFFKIYLYLKKNCLNSYIVYKTPLFEKKINSLFNTKKYLKKKIIKSRKRLGWYYPLNFPLKKKKKFKNRKVFWLPDSGSQNTYDLIVNIKKRNLFLTFLDHNKNVLVKNNLGSFNFKGRNKFTNISLMNSSEFFNYRLQTRLKFIINLLYNKIWFVLGKFLKQNKNLKNNNNKINNVFCFKTKKLLSKTLYFQLLKYRKIFRFNRIQSKKKFIKKIIKGDYLFFVLIYKTNPKDWPFRFVMKGLSWKGLWKKKKKLKLKINKLHFCKILDKRTKPHSYGLRLRKMRRV